MNRPRVTNYMTRKHIAVLVTISCSFAHPSGMGLSGQGEEPGSGWWHDVQVLADDSMHGRAAGSPDYERAAAYVESQFRGAGLQSSRPEGFSQTVPLVLRSVDDTRSSLTLVRGGSEESLVLGEDAMLMPRAPLVAQSEGDLVFAGYGLDLPEYGHDDLRGLDLRGKVVVYLAGKPKGIPGPVLSHARNQAWAAFRAAGAIGMVAFSTARTDSAFRAAATNRAAAMSLSDEKLDVQAGNHLSVQMNLARGEKLFAGTPERFASLVARADSGLPLPRFALGARLRARAAVNETRVTSENVIGVLPGSDPALHNEYVVLTAHLDHLGIGKPVKGDSIYNGAMDNASGTALLMDLARNFAREHAAFRRSVIFAAVTAEEEGRLGSTYFANHPTVDGRSIVADINTDMFLPMLPLTMVMVNGLEESDLATDVRRAGESVGVKIVTDPEPEENRFVRSDQYSFVLRGIPALSLKVGFALGSAEQRTARDFLTNRYHKPSDDTSQPVNLKTAAGFERLLMALVREVSNRDTRPSWFGDSYFRRFADDKAPSR